MIKMMPLDMSWFLIESKPVPVHGAFLHVFTPPAGARPDYARRLLATLKARAVGAPFNLRPRLKLGVLPYWEQVTVDLDQHVFETRLPKPGNDSQLMAVAAKLAGPTLTWSAPLWRVHWIDGLAGGRFAFMLVAHHSQFDGMGVLRLLHEIMAESPRSKSFEAPWHGESTWRRLAEPKSHEAPHSKRPAQVRAANNVLGTLTAVAQTASSLGKMLFQQGWHAALGKRRLALPMSAPEARPERNGSVARTYGMSRFPVASVKAVAHATGTSFNDVMSAAINAGYERYLGELGLPVSKPLVALVPMAIKVPGAGNQISGAVVPLGSPGAGPRARLHEVSAAMTEAKHDMETMGSTAAKLYAMAYMGVTAGPDLLHVGDRLPATANIMISNPYGLPKTLYFNGSKMDYFLPLIGPSLGTRIMFGVYSYADTAFVSITSLRSVVPDMDRLCVLIDDAFAELLALCPALKPKAAVGGRTAQAQAPSPRKRKTAATTAAKPRPARRATRVETN